MKKLITTDLGRLSAEEYKKAPKNNVIIALDNIRSLNNVGSAFRTGDAFSVEKILLMGITGTPPHRDIHKTALGAQEVVNWEKVDQPASYLEELKIEGYKIVAVEQTSESQMLENVSFDLNGKYVFVFGNEVMGVDDEILKIVDYALEIPQFGTKHSLNISVSLGVVLWEFIRQTKLISAT